MKIILSSYENQSQKITDLEMKLRTQQKNYEKKQQNIENKYIDEITNLNKVISNYEKILTRTKSISLAQDIGNINANYNRKLLKECNKEISTLTIVISLKHIYTFINFCKYFK